jgi:hypothetical protein
MLSSPNDESPANIEAAVSSPDNLLYTDSFTGPLLVFLYDVKILHVCLPTILVAINQLSCQYFKMIRI